MKRLFLTILIPLCLGALPACKSQQEKDYEAAMKRHQELKAAMKERQESYEKRMSKSVNIDPLKPWDNLEHPQQISDKPAQQKKLEKSEQPTASAKQP